MHSAFRRVFSSVFALLVFTMAASAQPSRAPSLTIASPANVEAGLAESKSGKILVVVMDSHINSPNLWVAWNDASVKEWIANNATCLRYERGSYNPQEGEFKALESVDHGVVAFRNGEIYDRDTSFATAADLIEWLKRVKEGTITAEYARARAGERLETTPSKTLVILAERLDRVGDTAGADAEYAWLIERQLSRQRGRSDERYMPQSNWIFPNLSPDAQRRGIAHLKADKEAVARLTIIRDRAATDAEANPDDRAAIVAWFGVQQIVPDLPRIVAWYERISKGTKHASQAKNLWQSVFTSLIAEGDWATAGRIMDRPLGKLGVHTMRAEAIQLMGSGTRKETGPIVADEGDAAAVYWGSMYYAALLAADRETDARLVAETLIEYFNTPITHRALVRMALKANEPREIHRDWADIADSNEKTIEKIRPEVDEALKSAANPIARGSYASLPDRPKDGLLPAASDDKVVVTGQIVREVSRKDIESIQAGGEEYFVLVRDEGSNPKRVILRLSQTHPSIDAFKSFAGKRVEITGRHAGYYKYKVDDRAQHPTGIADRDGFALGGGGLLVDSIKVIP